MTIRLLKYQQKKKRFDIMIKFIKENKKYGAICIIILCFLGIIALLCKSIYGLIYPSVIEIIANITVIISCIIAFFTLYWFIMDYKKRYATSRTEKAIQLAEEYANDIMNKITYIGFVMKDIGISDLIEHIDSTGFHDFTYNELCRLLTAEEIKTIKEKLYSNKISDKIFLKNKALSLSNYKDISEFLRLLRTVSEEAPKNNRVSVFQIEFNSILADVLNQLEYFSMWFVTGVADEKAVYQSLHQTFLKHIKFLYYPIASINKSGTDKYYTNIIKLYNLWSDERKRQINLELSHEKDLENKVVRSADKV